MASDAEKFAAVVNLGAVMEVEMDFMLWTTNSLKIAKEKL